MNQAFLKLLPKFMSRVDIDGIRFLPTNKTERVKIYDGKIVEAPVFKLWNSKNVPFSYNSLVDLLTLELEELGKIVSSDIGYGQIEKFVKIEMQSYVYDIASSDSYTYEAPIWLCVSDVFTEYETFLNTDWQYVSLTIIPK